MNANPSFSVKFKKKVQLFISLVNMYCTVQVLYFMHKTQVAANIMHFTVRQSVVCKTLLLQLCILLANWRNEAMCSISRFL
jgi:hypothetical protein